MAISVLLLEDNYDLAAAVAGSLELEGIICDHAGDGEQCLELALGNLYDVLILDVMVPRLDGFGVCSRLRGKGVTTPILMLTARDSLEDKTEGFRAGTDDYLTKPFEMEELLLRIRALAKRYSRQNRKIVAGGLVMNRDTREVLRNGQAIHLTPTEWTLLEVLMEKSPHVISRARLEQAVWGDELPSAGSLKVYLSRLRKKIDADSNDSLIQTLPGVGVVLKSE